MIKLLKHIKTKTDDYILTVCIRPSWFMRKFFNKDEYECDYIGSGTVWHTFPGLIRCSSFLESGLCDIYKKIRFDEDNKG